MPAGTARQRARRSPAPASWKVAGNRSRTKPMAGSPWRSDSPKLPWIAPVRKRPYWTIHGSSKPMALRKRAMSSAVASGGRSSAAGSPVRWRIANTTTDTPKRTSTACHRRRRMYDFIQLRGPRNGPRTPPFLRRRVRAGRAPPSPAPSCSPAHVTSPWPPHSPILAPARPCRTRTAVARSIMLSCPRHLAMAPALPHPCAGASLPDAHRRRTYNLARHLPRLGVASVPRPHLRSDRRAREASDGFDVWGVREHVHRLDPVHAIAAVHELAEVAGEGGRIARDVHDAGGSELDQRAQRLGMEPGAGGIRHHRLRAHALGDELGQGEADLAGEEGAVLDLVGHGVAGGVGHRGGRELDAVDVTTAPRELQADGARARVEIEDRLAARELRRLEHESEEALGLRGIRLEERVRGDLELDAAQRLANVIAAAQEVLLDADGHARLLRIDVHHHARGARGERAHPLGEGG